MKRKRRNAPMPKDPGLRAAYKAVMKVKDLGGRVEQFCLLAEKRDFQYKVCLAWATETASRISNRTRRASMVALIERTRREIEETRRKTIMNCVANPLSFERGNTKEREQFHDQMHKLLDHDDERS